MVTTPLNTQPAKHSWNNIFYVAISATHYFISFSSVATASPIDKATVLVDDTIPFSYNETTGRGPSKWGEVNPLWRACGEGKLQSPIDIDHRRAEADIWLGDLTKDYKPSPATIVSRGRDLAVTWKGDAGKTQIYGMDYNLQHCHWHMPSEHSYNGQKYDLELHLVHNNTRGQIAVAAILYQLGEPDPFLSKLLPYIKVVTKVELDLGILDPAAIRLRRRVYYRYNGSLSVPPCTEGVLWTLYKKVRTVSAEQAQALRAAVDSEFQENARPIQNLYARGVYLYNPAELGKLS